MNDSLQVSQPAKGNTYRPAPRQFTAAHVISKLSPDATPAQQDSAVQANLPVRDTVRSTCPDTLNLPGWDIPPTDTAPRIQTKLYDNNYFSASPYYHAEISFSQNGVEAEPMPYMPRNDDGVTAVILGCLFIAMFVLARRKGILTQRLKEFFDNRPGKEKSIHNESGREKFHTVLIILQGGVLAALLGFYYTQATHDLFMIFIPPHIIFGIYIIYCALYFFLKKMLYSFVNWIFFEKESRREFTAAYLYLYSVESLLLVPLILVTVYFNLSVHYMTLCVLGMLCFIKVLLLYKTVFLFFPKKYGLLHLIVYFCTLEMLPIMCLWQALVYTNEILL